MSDIRKPRQTASPGQDLDAGFDAFLRENDSRIKTLYRKLPHPEPDTELDSRVRALARRALHGQTAQPTPPARARRWLPAFATAATLMLVAGLAWRLVPPHAPSREALPMADSAAPTASAAASGNAAPVAQQPIAAAPAPQTSAKAAMQEPRDRYAMGGEAKAAPDAAAAANDTVAASPQPAAPAFAARADAEPAAFPHATEAARAKSVLPSKPAPSPATAAAPRLAATKGRAETTPEHSHDSLAQVRGLTIDADPSVPTRYRWKAPGDAATPARSGTYPPDPPPLPGWVEIVRRMLRDGHRDAAKQALAELRARHPDYLVPGDLRPLE